MRARRCCATAESAGSSPSYLVTCENTTGTLAFSIVEYIDVFGLVVGLGINV